MKNLEALFLNLNERVESLKKELSQTNTRLNSILAHISSGLLFVGLDGTIQLTNPALHQLTGIPYLMQNIPYETFFQDDFFGFSLTQALTYSDKKNYKSLITTSIEGKQVELEVTAVLIKDLGLLILITDCTERNRLEKAVQQNDRLAALGEMGATLAHEIRNPLGGIAGFTALLKAELEDERHLKYLSYISEGTKTLNHLVTSVLDYSRPVAIQFSRINLIEVIEKASFLFEGKCRLHSPTQELWIHGDQERLCGAFLNLFRNSHEAGSPHVDVDVSSSGKVKVKDKGCGIQKELQEKIFTPFFTTKVRGNGLGLPEVRKVITAHGGEIHIENSSKECGTTFCIQLPKVEK